MSTIPEVVPSIWEWVWRTSLHVCVIVCVIRIVQLSLRRVMTPRWQYALWMLVLIRMVMPIGLETPWSVYNLFRTEPAPQTVNVQPVPAYDWVFESMTQPVFAPMPVTTVQPDQSLDWSTGLALVWIAGMVMLSIHLLLQWRRLNRIVTNGRVNESEPLGELMNACVRALGLRRTPKVVECDIAVPGLYGFLRPTLLLPKGLASALDANELRYILLHELSHAKRRDLPVNWLMTQMQVLHWFNPLVWHAFMRMRTDRELACDALALSHAGPDESQAYGNTLLKLMDANHGLRPTPGMIGILENHAHLKRRIVAIAQFTTRSYKWSIPALIVLGLVAATTLTQAMQEEVGNEEPVDEPASEPVPETEAEPKRGGLQNVHIDGAIRIREPRNGPEPSEKMLAILEQEITMKAERAHVALLLKKFGRQLGFTVVMDHEVVAPAGAADASGYVSDGMIDYVNLEKVQFQDAVRALMRPLGLATVISGDTMLVTTPERALGMRYSAVTAKSPPSLAPEIDARLDESAWVVLPDREFHLEEFLQALSEATDLNFMADNRVVAPMPGSGEETSETVITDGMLRNEWDFRDVPAREILSTVLTRLGLVYSVQQGFVWISSPEYVRHESFADLETRYYTLDAVAAERVVYKGDPSSLLETLGLFAPAILEPITGKDLSFMRYDAEKKQLIVHHTPSNHWKIEQWLLEKKLVDAEPVPESTVEPARVVEVEAGVEPQAQAVVEPDREMREYPEIPGMEVVHADRVLRNYGEHRILRLEGNVQLKKPNGVITSLEYVELWPDKIKMVLQDGSESTEPRDEPAVEPQAEDVQNVEVGGDIRIRWRGFTSPADPLEEKLKEQVSIKGESMHVIPILRMLAKQEGVAVEFDLDVIAPPGAEDTDQYVTDGVIEYLDLKRVTLRQVIDAMLRPLNLAPIILHDRVLVTSAARAEKYRDGMRLADAPAGLESTMPELDEPVDFVFTGTDAHLSRLLSLLSERSGINFMIDKRYVAPAPGEDAPTPDSVYTDGILNGEWRLRNVSPRQALDDMLPFLGLVYTVQQGFVWITSPESARHETFEDLETRYYELDEATAEALGFGNDTEPWRDSLEFLAPPVLEPDTGRELSFIQYNTDTRQLVVHQTPSNQWQIEQFLNQAKEREHALEPDATRSIRASEVRLDSPIEPIPEVVRESVPRSKTESNALPGTAPSIEPPPHAEAAPMEIPLSESAPRPPTERGEYIDGAYNFGTEELNSFLDKLISYRGRDVHIIRVLESILTGAGFSVEYDKGIVAPEGASNPEDYVWDGMIPALRVEDVSFREFLRIILEPHDLRPLYGRHGVFITSASRLDAPPKSFLLQEGSAVFEPVAMEKRLGAKTGLYVQEGMHLSDTLQLIARRSGINMLVDDRVVARPGGAAGKLLDGVLGFSKRYRNESVRVILDKIASDLGLAYVSEPSFVWITSVEFARDARSEGLETHQYVVHQTSRRSYGPIIAQLAPRIFDPVRAEPLTLLDFDEEEGRVTVRNTPSHHRRLNTWLSADPDFVFPGEPGFVYEPLKN